MERIYFPIFQSQIHIPPKSFQCQTSVKSNKVSSNVVVILPTAILAIFFTRVPKNLSSKITSLSFLKGQLHNQAEIFKGLKMTFRTKNFE